MPRKKIKALVLLSGGLDSQLAAKLLIEQGIESAGICFTSAFFSERSAVRSAQELDIRLEIIDISRELLALVKSPPSGRGRNLNPCVDCHALMIARAGAWADRKGYDILATGEVLGQRPFSQNRQALGRVRRLAEREVLRPLSAKRLEPTGWEKSGLVRRSRLLDLSGRSRAPQLRLAEKYGLKNFSPPAGGCALTDPGYASRLDLMLKNWPAADAGDAALLKYGRVFWLERGRRPEDKILIIVGRDKSENLAIKNLKKQNDILVRLVNNLGPTTLVRAQAGPLAEKNRIIQQPIPLVFNDNLLKHGITSSPKEILGHICALTGYYAPKFRGLTQKFEIVV